MRKEIENLNQTHLNILESFSDYKSMHRRRTRSVLPFVGSALSFLFEVVSEDQLSQIRHSVGVLARNQQSILHVVKDSLTILNMSRVEISENRHAITDLIIALQQTDVKIKRISQEIEKQSSQLEQFMDMYLKLDLIIGELKQMTQRAMFYLENLRLQLNLLSMGRLSPSIISPSNLRQLLLDVKARLPTTLKLANDPQVDLWFFYKI